MRLALPLATALLLFTGSAFHLASAAPVAASAATPLAIGESFTIDSQALKEQRHINVYVARAWDTRRRIAGGFVCRRNLPA